MNLCIVSSGDYFSDYGGGQVYVRNIVNAFIENKQAWSMQLSVISCHPNFNKKANHRDYSGLTVYEINPKGVIEELLKLINPDIVHINGEKLLFANACKKLCIPCIVTVHHGGMVCPAGALLNFKDEICKIPANYSHCLKCYLRNTHTGLFWYPLLKSISKKRYIKFGKQLKRLPFIPFLSPIGETGLIVSQKLQDWKELSANATHFIAPSNAIAEALKRNGCSQEKISVIPHGIPNSEFRISNFEFRISQFTIHNSQLIKFYYVGRINYVKGIHILLKAFTSIDNPNTELHLIGGAGNKSEQRYENKLKKKYCKDNRIIWHGKLPYEKTKDVTKDFQCLIHPTICLEVYGLDIAEAMATGKYVISTRCGGAEMQIHNENEGLLVAPNDVKALRDAIIQYIDFPRQSSAKVTSIEDHVSNLIKLYKSVVEKKN